MQEADPDSPTLLGRIEALEATVFLLQGALAQALNALPPEARRAAWQAISARGRPTIGGAAYSTALQRLGREVKL